MSVAPRSRVALPVVAGAIALGVAGSGSARPGKVVKVERTTATDPDVAACLALDPRNLVCFAGEVKAADRLHVFADDGEYWRVEISSIRPSGFDSCQLGELRDARVNVLERTTGAGTSTGHIGTRLALKDIPGLSRRTRLLPSDSIPSPERGAETMFVVDLDGDGGADLALTNRECPETTSSARTSKRVTRSDCLSFWFRDRHARRWRQIRRAVIHQCR